MTAALNASKRIGYQKVTRHDIALEAGVSDNLVSNYWGTMTQLRRDIMRHAVRTEVLEVIAQGLVAGDSQAGKASLQLKQQALEQLM